MKTKKIAVISGIVALILILITISQMSNFGTNMESVFAEKSYSQIEDYEVRNAGGAISFSVKTKSDLPSTGKDFEKSKVISFGYAWLVPNGTNFCLFSEPIVNGVSAGDRLVRTILSEDQLDFSPHDIDMAVSVVILENLSCSSGFEAKIVNELKKG